MQLFILDRDPAVAVQYLADCHVRKMCMETAQILSSVMLNRGMSLIPVPGVLLPRPFNVRHPVVLAIDTPGKASWVVDYFGKLLDEFHIRFGKEHAWQWTWGPYATALHSIEPCDFTFARDFKGFTTAEQDIVEAHRDYYRYKKATINCWKYTRRLEPGWLRKGSYACNKQLSDIELLRQRTIVNPPGRIFGDGLLYKGNYYMSVETDWEVADIVGKRWCFDKRSKEDIANYLRKDPDMCLQEVTEGEIPAVYFPGSEEFVAFRKQKAELISKWKEEGLDDFTVAERCREFYAAYRRERNIR